MSVFANLSQFLRRLFKILSGIMTCAIYRMQKVQQTVLGKHFFY